jgi:hypothetical protein
MSAGFLGDVRVRSRFPFASTRGALLFDITGDAVDIGYARPCVVLDVAPRLVGDGGTAIFSVCFCDRGRRALKTEVGFLW